MSKELLHDMAKLTMLTNKLNDVQLKNLKSFPLIFFEGLQGVVLEYDLSNNMTVETEEDGKTLEVAVSVANTGSHHHVTYRLAVEDSIPKTHMDQRFKTLEVSVRGILWNTVKVRVFINENLVYQSAE